MSQAIEIIDKLETSFSKEQAKVLADVILAQESHYHENLVTKDYLHKEMSEMKFEFGAGLNQLRQDINDRFAQMDNKINDRFEQMDNKMNDRFTQMDNKMNDRFTLMGDRIIDVQKSITRMTVFFITAIGTIAIILKVLDIVFKQG